MLSVVSDMCIKRKYSQMIITRKIEIFVCESDKDLKKSYYQKLYDNRNIAVKVANMCASHLFALDNTMPYLSDEGELPLN